MIATPHANDSYVQILRDTLGSRGMTGFDCLAQSPGRGIIRTYETGRSSGKSWKEYFVPEGWIIASGVAVALCQDSLVRPALPQYEPLHIVGFVHRAIEGNRVSVRTCGGILLTVKGATEQAQGRNVYCTGPNSFTVDDRTDGLLLGEVDYVQNGKALVRFGGSGESGKDIYRAPSHKHY